MAMVNSSTWMVVLFALFLFGAAVFIIPNEQFGALKLVLGIAALILSILGYFSLKWIVLWEDRMEFRFLFHKKIFHWHELEGWFPVSMKTTFKVGHTSETMKFSGLRLVKKEKKDKSLNFNTILLDADMYRSYRQIEEIVLQKLPQLEKPEWANELEK
ncbi:MAG: hypothetical protein MI810_13110 [Flavobacteriales bacterium]|nr:hypothetical protein [Flavobacteriales bacterium]